MPAVTEPITATPPSAIERPVLQMQWRAVSYLHWALPPAVVAAQLPPGLTPDLHAGRAYVGLVPFMMAGIARPTLKTVSRGLAITNEPAAAPQMITTS